MIREYLGMSGKDAIKRLPSYIRGSILQTIASHQEVRDYNHSVDNPHVLLVPGLFCSPSVFNNLGEELESELNVWTPTPFPYWFSMLCNTAAIEKSAVELCKTLYYMNAEGVYRVSLVGHSLGGLIIAKA
jgi:pimeloyl-ACP methyl ester carboxylesterase